MSSGPDIDNREFIIRHHKTGVRVADKAEAARAMRGRFWALGAFLIFVVVLVFIAYDTRSGTISQASSAFAFMLAGLGGFVAYRSYSIHARREKDIALIRALLEGSRAARMVTDGNDRTIYCNQKFVDLCRGFGEPGYKTLVRLFQNNEEALSHFRALADSAHRGLNESIELFSRIEEREKWLMITVQPVVGYPGYIHWRVDDVTDKYMSEQALIEEREKLIDFTDNAPVGFFSVNEHGRFVFANATLARWLGEDLKGLLDYGTLHTYLVNPPKDGALYELVDDARDRQVVEIYMKGTGGRTFLAAINQAVVREESGRVRTRAVVYDLTAESRMKTALKESEARFQKFFEEAPVGILLVDDDGKVADCNSMFAHMIGVHAQDIEGRNFGTLVSAEDRDAVMSAVTQMGQEGQPMKSALEVTIEGKRGSMPTQMHARRFKEGGHTVLHFIDVTEQKQLETQFVQSQKMQAIGQLAGGVAHDFNNLLTAMIGFCDLLLLRHKPGDPSFADIMQIKQNSNRAANLVRQLLAFSRQQTLRPHVQDITDVLTELSHLLRRLIGSNIDLQLVHGKDLGFVKIDESQMEQVLINLAVNARDAMDGGGVLKIETFNHTNRKSQELLSEELPPGHWTAIRVTDTGCGIPPENMTRIFEPFFTTKEVGHGTGLGLAMVYGIVRQTGGFLDVQSEPGTGTAFTIYLPRTTETDEEPAQASSKGGDEEIAGDLTGSEKILLVEDEDAVRTFSQRALTNKGYKVLAAESGETAIALIEKEENRNLDLLITDVVMPNMDGPTLAKRVREISPDLKIIFISGYTEDKLKDYMGHHIWFLPKPFTLKQLASKVKEVLGK